MRRRWIGEKFEHVEGENIDIRKGRSQREGIGEPLQMENENTSWIHVRGDVEQIRKEKKSWLDRIRQIGYVKDENKGKLTEKTKALLAFFVIANCVLLYVLYKIVFLYSLF